MKLYLAGKFGDRHGPMGEKRDALIELGHDITHDWMTFETPTRNHADKGVMAYKDIGGVKAADAVIIVMDDPEYTYRGSYAELGATLALGKPICMVSPLGPDFGFKSNVFWHHPSIAYAEDWPAALSWLAKLAHSAERHEEDTVDGLADPAPPAANANK